VNWCKKLESKFPEDHAEQHRIAQGFKACSPQAKFSNCVGAIYGILIWIEKPWKPDCKLTACGPKKLFCGHKKKFGLNMHAVCDA
jgi:hypothetical protein